MAKVRPHADVTIYPAGGDGYASDPGFAYESVCAHDAAAYTTEQVTVNDKKVNGIILIDEGEQNRIPYSACIPYPYVVYQDHDENDWTLTSGTWVEMGLDVAIEKTRLLQVKATHDTAWQIETKYDIPAEPTFAVTLWCYDIPKDQTQAKEIHFRFGDYKWAIISDRKSKGYLAKKVGTEWQVKLEFPWEVRREEGTVMVMNLRKRLLVSSDHGERWYSYSEGLDYYLSGTGIELEPGHLRVVANGGCAMIGLHQVKGQNAWVKSHRIPLMEDRSLQSPTLTKYTLEPESTSVTVTQVTAEGEVEDDELKWKAELAVDTGTPTGAPWAFYFFPELHSVYTDYDIDLVAAAGSASSIGDVLTVDIDLPEQLDVSEARWTQWLGGYDDKSAFATIYRGRRCKVYLGYVMHDDSTNEGLVFSGNITDVRVLETNERGEMRVEFVARGPLERMKRITAVVDETWRPLDGMTIYNAMKHVLNKRGLPNSRIDFGAMVPGLTLGIGPPERRAWPPQPDKNIYDLLKELAAQDNKVLTEKPNGDIYVMAWNFFNESSYATYRADGTTGAELTVLEATNDLRYSDLVTSVFISGVDGNGDPLWAAAFDFDAERNPTSDNFEGTRFQERDRGEQFLTAADAQYQAAWRLAMRSPTVVRPIITIMGDQGVDRRDWIRVVGANVGVGSGDRLVVMAVHHHWDTRMANTRTRLHCEVI